MEQWDDLASPHIDFGQTLSSTRVNKKEVSEHKKH